MFTSVAQDVRALDPTKYTPELLRVLGQLANCAAEIQHYGEIQDDFDGYFHSTNTGEEFHALSTDNFAGDMDVPGVVPHAALMLVNPAAIFVQGQQEIHGGAAINVQGVWLQRPSPAQSNDTFQVTLVSPHDIQVNNLVVVNVLNAQGNFQLVANVIVWVANANAGANLISIGDYQYTLVDTIGSAPRIPGCRDTHSVDLATTATTLAITQDLINLRADFTVAIRLKLVWQSNRTEHYWEYRESIVPFTVAGVKLQGEWADVNGTPKLRFTASTTPTDISPTGVGVPARSGREYPSGSCVAVFVRWRQSDKTLTLNVLQEGDVGSSATNDEVVWSPSYGDYILSEGPDTYLQIRGEDAPAASMYMERFAIWNHRLSDSQVRYDFSY